MKYSMKPIGELCEISRKSIFPSPNETYSVFSLPAFDDNKTPEVSVGSSIKSSKLIVEVNTILYNKLNVHFKRVWNIGDEIPNNSIASTEFIPLKVKENVDRNYLYYNLIGDNVSLAMYGERRGTSNSQQRIDSKALLSFEIPVPPFAEQCKISNILTNIDKKIAINTMINENLFLQLHAMYREMIVNSDSTDDITLSKLCMFQEGYVNPAQTHPEYFDGDVKWLRAADINESFIIDTSRTLTKVGFESAKKSALLFEPNTIAISKSGTIGRLGIIADYMCGNRAVINIKPNEQELLPLIYCFLKSKQTEFLDLAVGSVQKNLYVSLLESLILSLPSEKEDIATFSSAANSLLSVIHNNCIENLRLSALRDTLLPKLMNGEIDVSKVQI